MTVIVHMRSAEREERLGQVDIVFGENPLDCRRQCRAQRRRTRGFYRKSRQVQSTAGRQSRGAMVDQRLMHAGPRAGALRRIKTDG